MRAHAREQLADPEGLGDVVVGAGVEAVDDVQLAVLGGQEQDRDGRPLRADAAADLEAVDAGQADVDDDEIVFRVVAGGEPQRVLTGRDAIDGVALTLQRPRERDADPLVVLDDQQAGHGLIVGRWTRPRCLSVHGAGWRARRDRPGRRPRTAR